MSLDKLAAWAMGIVIAFAAAGGRNPDESQGSSTPSGISPDDVAAQSPTP